MLKDLGLHIRKIRKEKGLTLVEIAEKTGIAQATLSRIETGSMIGTVESHEKIAETLGIPLAELYGGVDQRLKKTEHQSGEVIKPAATFQGHKVNTRLLTSQNYEKKITPILITLESGGNTEEEKQEVGVEKFIWAFEGKVEVLVGSETYPLYTGETLYFDASLPHSIKNTDSAAAKVFVAVSPARI